MLHSSPAIGAGNNDFVHGDLDLYGQDRLVNTNVDIGAVEHQLLTANSTFNQSLSASLYPNPCKNNIQLNGIDVQKAVIYTIDGENVKSVSTQELERQVINTTVLEMGLYILQTFGNGETQQHTFIKL